MLFSGSVIKANTWCAHMIIMDLWLSIGVNYLEITCVHLIFINTNIFVIIGGGERPTPTLNPEPCRHLCLADMSNENIFYLPLPFVDMFAKFIFLFCWCLPFCWLAFFYNFQITFSFLHFSFPIYISERYWLFTTWKEVLRKQYSRSLLTCRIIILETISTKKEMIYVFTINN